MSADGRLIIREEEDGDAKMEEEEGAKGGATCPFRSCSWPGPGLHSFAHSSTHLFVHSATILERNIGKNRYKELVSRATFSNFLFLKLF